MPNVLTTDIIDDFVQYLEWEFGGVAQVADLEAYTNAVENEFGQSGERRQAIAAVMLTVDRLWNTVVDQVGEYLLSRIQEEVAADFETDKQYGLCDYLVGRWEVWPLRRPTWPENCMVGLEPQQLDAKSILVGVKAPDPRDSRVQKEHGSAARAQLDRLTDQVGGGRTSPWWAWHKALEPSSWDTDYIARLILESPKGDVTQHPAVQQLGDLVVELGRVVEARLNAGRQPA